MNTKSCKKLWNKEEKKLLKRLYPNVPWSDLLKALPGRTRSSIYTKGSKMKLKRNINLHFPWTDKEINIMKNIYPFESKEKILSLLNRRSWGAVLKYAQRMRVSKIRNNVNIYFFDKWSPKMAYVLGFMYSDGSILHCKSDRSYDIGFHQKKDDINLLKMIKKLIGSHHKIYCYENNSSYSKNIMCRLVFSSIYMYKRLKELDVKERKKYKVYGFPKKIPGFCIPHFIRGYLDGDGCITNKGDRFRVSFRGNKQFLEDLNRYIKKLLNIEGGLYNCTNHFALQFWGLKALRLCRFIYEDSSGIYLERKYNIYKDYSGKFYTTKE